MRFLVASAGSCVVWTSMRNFARSFAIATSIRVSSIVTTPILGLGDGLAGAGVFVGCMNLNV